MGVEDALKEFFGLELTDLKTTQVTQQTKISEFEGLILQLDNSIQQSAGENQKLRDELGQKQNSIDELSRKVQELIDMNVNEVKIKVDDIKSVEDSLSTKVSELERIVNESTERIRQSNDTVTDGRNKILEFAEQIAQSRKICAEMQKLVGSNNIPESLSDRVDQVQKQSEDVKMRQDNLEDAVNKKYGRLWTQVEKSLGEMNTDHFVGLKDEIDQKHETVRMEVQKLMNYSTKVMAKTMAERKQHAIGKAIVMQWRQQSYTTARRRMGLLALHNLFIRRQKNVWGRWSKRTAYLHLAEKVRKEYNGKIPDFRSILEESGLEKKCRMLEDAVDLLKREKAPQIKVDQAMAEQKEDFLNRLKVIDELKANIASNLADIKKLSERTDGQDSDIEDLRVQIEENIKATSDVAEQLVDLASTKDVQAMMKDILLIWNSIKQLDAAKADQKEVDMICTENSKKEKRMHDRFDFLESDSATRVSQGVMDIQEKMVEVDNRVKENARNFTHWQEKWDTLAGFVEDLVAKIADIQGFVKPEGVKAGSASARSSSRGAGSRRDPGYPGVRQEHVTISSVQRHDEGGGLSPRGAPEHGRAMDEWISSARNVAFGAIDEAMSQAQPPRTRPGQSGRPPSAGPRTPAREGAYRGREDHDREAVVISGTRVTNMDVEGGGPHLAGGWRQGSSGSLNRGGGTPSGGGWGGGRSRQGLRR